MTTRKRIAPERRPGRREEGPVSRAASAAFALAAARPGLSAGLVVFAIVLGTVSANALWYQPKGGHPSPLLRTRDAHDPSMLLGFSRDDDPQDVTTYRIERPDDTETGSIGTPASQRIANDLVRAAQEELIRLGYYSGPADGLAGQMTSTAVAAFQRAAKLPETGEVSPTLLPALKARQTAASAQSKPAPAQVQPPVAGPSTPVAHAVVPAERPALPRSAPAAQPAAPDPVAEAIRNASPPLQSAAKQPSVAAAKPVPVAAANADPAVVARIQRGLSKVYAGIVVDGIAGEGTRQSIRSFEKHYNLPVTGEPSERVLKKLKDIGAL